MSKGTGTTLSSAAKQLLRLKAVMIMGRLFLSRAAQRLMHHQLGYGFFWSFLSLQGFSNYAVNQAWCIRWDGQVLQRPWLNPHLPPWGCLGCVCFLSNLGSPCSARAPALRVFTP